MSILQLVFLQLAFFLKCETLFYGEKKLRSSTTITNPEVNDKDTLADKHMGKHILVPDLTRIQEAHMFQSIAVAVVLHSA